MQVVIDANTFSSITNPLATDHEDFRPVLEYVTYGNGVLSYGGSKYQTEVNQHGRFKGLLEQLNKARKTKEAPTGDVDATQAYLETNFRRAGFNDHHLIAIVVVNGSEVICSKELSLPSLISVCFAEDARMLISRNCVCTPRLRRPRIYKRKEHARYWAR